MHLVYWTKLKLDLGMLATSATIQRRELWPRRSRPLERATRLGDTARQIACAWSVLRNLPTGCLSSVLGKEIKKRCFP